MVLFSTVYIPKSRKLRYPYAFKFYMPLMYCPFVVSLLLLLSFASMCSLMNYCFFFFFLHLIEMRTTLLLFLFHCFLKKVLNLNNNKRKNACFKIVLFSKWIIPFISFKGNLTFVLRHSLCTCLLPFLPPFSPFKK